MMMITMMMIMIMMIMIITSMHDDKDKDYQHDVYLGLCLVCRATFLFLPLYFSIDLEVSALNFMYNL